VCTRAELLAAAAPQRRLVEDADQVDDDVAAVECVFEDRLVMHVGTDEPHGWQDLAGRWCRAGLRISTLTP
jgi:hypothetical protein